MSTDLITEHLDLWTSAVTYNNGRGRGNNGEPELTGIEKLRELILELAVRGKLAPQDPEDEPASELLERIEGEKARLYKEGKIKKPKKLPEIGEEEKPSDLPDGWAFARLGDLLERISNGLSGKQNKEGKGYPLTRIETISKGEIDLEKLGYSNDISESKLESYRLMEGDILLSHINSDYHIGKTAIVPSGLEIYHGVNLLLVRVVNELSPKYIDKFLNSLRLGGYFIDIAQQAIGQASVNQSKIKNIVIPLPPASEQTRIVQKVDELMALCDRLEQQTSDQLSAHETLVDTLLDTLTRSQDAAELADNWARLAVHFDTLFTTEHSIDRLEQTILQLAVMGRLVPQDPNDEPASKLLERIEEEKERLYKEGKIKKPKKRLKITDDQSLFKLPQGWEWCYLNDIGSWGSGATPKRGVSEYYGGGIPWFKSGELTNDFISGSEETITEKALDETSVQLKPSGSVLVAMYGATIGKASILENYATTNQAVCACRPFSGISNRYLLTLLKAYRKRFIEMGAGGAQPNISNEKIVSTVIALPPEVEQERIVEKVEEVMALCDRLKSQLNEAGETQQRLAESIVKQAVA